MDKCKIERINQLTAISRERELTPAEQEERTLLREEYRQAVRGNLETQLKHTYVMDIDGKITPLRK